MFKVIALYECETLFFLINLVTVYYHFPTPTYFCKLIVQLFGKLSHCRLLIRQTGVMFGPGHLSGARYKQCSGEMEFWMLRQLLHIY